MKTPIKISLPVLLLLLALLLPIPARADGIIFPPDPPICDPCPPPPCPGPWPCPRPSPMMQLNIRYHHVTVSIQDQVAVTHVDQVFYNPNDWAVEGTYIFPLPAEAAVSSFVLWVDGKAVEGEVLDAEQARRTYQQIVSSLRDPALLEYAGQGAVRASIFPIPPQGERRIELEYTQALNAEDGLVRYLYPLGTEKFSLQPLESVSINVEIRSSTPIQAVYSPSHTVDISRENDSYVKAGYEASQVKPDQDFALYYSVGEQQAFHVLSYRDSNDPQDADGFFLAMLAPRPQSASQEPLPKDVLLVLDRSGSMEGEKFTQAQEALRYVLGHLNPQDRFYVMAFSTGMERYASQLRPAEEAGQAVRWVDTLGAQGSTDINRALLEAAAISDRERPTYLIFLTDGLPTEGEVDSQKILDNFTAAAPSSLRLFAFGVGYDVDTFLLDSLAQTHHGATSYVLPGERIDELISAFYAKISTPVLTDLELDFGTLSVYDIYPSPLPDLFSGSQIIVTGRYRQGGSTTVTLSGQVDGQMQSFEFPGQELAVQSTPGSMEEGLPRLWATRKIGYLLNQIRLKGPDPETIDQVVRLSIRFGIVTPYTSYLVTEDAPLGASAQERIAEDAYNEALAAPAASVSGAAAVQKAAEQGDMAEAEAPSAPSGQAADVVRIAGTHTFVLQNEQWVDTIFDPERMTPVQVAFLSPDYFLLAENFPDLAAAFALGPAVIAVSQGAAYQVVDSQSSVAPIDFPATPSVDRPTPIAVLPAPTRTPGSPAQPAGAQPTSPPASPNPAPSACPGALLPLLFLALMWWVGRKGLGA